MHAQVLLGEARAVLATLEDASVDAVVTDPPYALTDKQGGSKGFMGASWDNGMVAHDPAFWAEVLRVAKPGAHLVAFGGTRTAHRLACAIEDAGWEIRDSLYLLWCHGQGFPKSLDVSKALDKMAGAEREAVGIKRASIQRNGQGENWARGAFGSHPESTKQVPITAPTTDVARQWDGWGTALKPSAEPIVLARKPLAEPTVAANVLAHGTGALHIDACRVATGEIGAPRAYEPRQDHEQWRITGGSNGSGATSPAGRWPPNTLLSHVGGPDGCQPAGVRRVRGAQGGGAAYERSNGTSVARAGGPLAARSTVAHADAEGYERVDAWTCVDGCPIKALDAQAGPRTSGAQRPGTAQTRGVFTHGLRARVAHEASTGGASRFFPAFPGPDPQDAVPFRYCSKASRRDRESGLEDAPAVPRSNGNKWTDQDYRVARGERTPGRESGPRRNTHPTCKPTALMAWLCKLVTPEGGVVLDCFAGSGSTGVACVREGFGFLGIEAEPSYVAIARRRIAHEQEQHAGPLFAGVGPAATAR